MLNDLKQPSVGNVEHLPALATLDRFGVLEVRAALLTTLRCVLNHPVRNLGPFQPGTVMTFLTALLLAR